MFFKSVFTYIKQKVVVLRLLSNSEIIGKLSKITSDGQRVKLILSINKEIEVPAEAFSHDELKKNLDQRIGIFNFNGEFFLRKIKSR